MQFTITVMLKTTFPQKTASGCDFKSLLMWRFKIDVGGDRKQLMY